MVSPQVYVIGACGGFNRFHSLSHRKAMPAPSSEGAEKYALQKQKTAIMTVL